MRRLLHAHGQAGDDDALSARAPRYHPACHAAAWPLVGGCDGPTRSVLLGRFRCRSRLFFRRLPGDAGSMPVGRFYSGEAPQGATWSQVTPAAG
ncbi:hypothetical protein HMPREF0591_0424 [Mycobacterium parascrofulaceum ATCC BAA-614]|uniref:Uncharacterized protein n=1 Tax=Mycobacterium parascrofulaceum ATCC BAA-614 TaxID=525368 RepID=D5P2N0_9MYCO|nr:hypothetical protein HMPREF0591_0424 [Mycobacterium parascrofulaceum ATCC BAA-614]